MSPRAHVHSVVCWRQSGALRHFENTSQDHLREIPKEWVSGVSNGPVTLNAIADLSTDNVLNVNLLTTLAYGRIKTLVTTQDMSVADARAQAEKEVLAELNIRGDLNTGNFGSLDLSQSSDGANMLAAVSSVFVQGNSAGALSSLIAEFQADMASDGLLSSSAIKETLATSASALDTANIAANLSAKYGNAIMSADLAQWIDQDGDGVIGAREFSVAGASAASEFTLPAEILSLYAGTAVTLSSGQLKVNGVLTSNPVVINIDDTIVVSPGTGLFPNGVFETYLLNGSTKLARIRFVKGIASLAVTPANPFVPKGTKQQMVATATFTDDSTGDVSTLAMWLSSATDVATIGTNGLANGVTVGTATITAAYGDVSGYTLMTVTPAVLQSITIGPANPQTGVGRTASLTATATFSDGSQLNVSGSVTWSSDTPAVETVNSATGLVTGVSLGSAVITATMSGISASVVFTVTDSPWATVGPDLSACAPVTPLSNGMIFVSKYFGYLYDPVGNTWSQSKGVVPEGVTFQWTAPLPDGRLLVGSTQGAVIYDTVSDAWSSAASLDVSWSVETATALRDGRVLVIRGYDGTLVIYDPASDSWVAAGSLAEARGGYSATLLQSGKVLVVGGARQKPNLDAPDPIEIATAEIFDPVTKSWSTAGNLTYARSYHTATLLKDGRVLITGGYAEFTNETSRAQAEIYDPSTNTWSSAGVMAGARTFHGAIQLPDGTVLVMGGVTGLHSSPLFTTEVYDPATNSWSLSANMPSAHVGASPIFLSNGDLLVMGHCTSRYDNILEPEPAPTIDRAWPWPW